MFRRPRPIRRSERPQCPPPKRQESRQRNSLFNSFHWFNSRRNEQGLSSQIHARKIRQSIAGTAVFSVDRLAIEAHFPFVARVRFAPHSATLV
jgi:hypothetical protein